jgi:hypothetical protein
MVESKLTECKDIISNYTKEEKLIDFLFSKSFIDIFLQNNTISQIEYNNCLKDLELIYLN